MSLTEAYGKLANNNNGEIKAAIKQEVPAVNNPQAPGYLNTNPLVIAGVTPFLLYAIGRVVVRRFFKDKVEIAKDRAETNILEVFQAFNEGLKKDLQEQKQLLEIISKERNEAVSELGRYLAIAESNKNEIENLKYLVASLTNKVEEQNKLLHSVLTENAQLKTRLQFNQGV